MIAHRSLANGLVGFGLTYADAMAAALACGEAVPEDIAAQGVSAAAVSPARFS